MHRITSKFLGRRNEESKKKTFVANLLIFIVVTLLSIGGGVVFVILEKEASEQEWKDLKQSVVNCTAAYLQSYPYRNPEAKSLQIFDKCIIDLVPKLPWGFADATIFSFAAITTLGFGSLVINTHGGRLFYIIYCMISMPLGLLLLGNLGQFVQDAMSKLRDAMQEYEKKRREKKKLKNPKKKKKKEVCPEDGLVTQAQKTEEDEEEEEDEFEVGGMLFLVLFILYVGAGVTVMILASELHVIDSVFHNFLTFTAVDLSEVVSTRLLLFPVGLAYVIGGLALGSLAFEILGRQLKQLHNYGKKMANSSRKKIWFGGKRLTVNKLVKAVGKDWGVDLEKIKNINLDKIVEHEVAVQEGTAEPEPIPEPKQDPIQARKASFISVISEVEVPQQRWGYFFKGNQEEVPKLPKLRNCGQKKIWLGGTRLTLDNLIDAIGKDMGIDKDKIENINLDKIVKKLIVSDKQETAKPEFRPEAESISEATVERDELDSGTVVIDDDGQELQATAAPDQNLTETGKPPSSKLRKFTKMLGATKILDSHIDSEFEADYQNSDPSEEKPQSSKLRKITKLFGGDKTKLKTNRLEPDDEVGLEHKAVGQQQEVTEKSPYTKDRKTTKTFAADQPNLRTKRMERHAEREVGTDAFGKKQQIVEKQPYSKASEVDKSWKVAEIDPHSKVTKIAKSGNGQPNLNTVEEFDPETIGIRDQKPELAERSPSSKLRKITRISRAGQQYLDEFKQHSEPEIATETIGKLDQKQELEEKSYRSKLGKITKIFGASKSNPQPDGLRDNRDYEYELGTTLPPNRHRQPELQKSPRLKHQTITGDASQIILDPNMVQATLEAQQEIEPQSESIHTPSVRRRQKDFQFRYSTSSDCDSLGTCGSSEPNPSFQELDGIPKQLHSKFDKSEMLIQQQLRKLKQKDAETLSNCSQTKVWFGPNRLTVHELLSAVGEELGVDREQIAKIDIDQIVKQEIMYCS